MKRQKELLSNLSHKIEVMSQNYKQHEFFYGKKPTALTSPEFNETLKCMQELKKLTRQ